MSFGDFLGHRAPLWIGQIPVEQRFQARDRHFRNTLCQGAPRRGPLGRNFPTRKLRKQDRQADETYAPCVTHFFSSIGRRYLPVKLLGRSTIRSGGPVPTISPPRSPPSGPRSMIQSAHLIISRLCSITITVLPALRSFINTCSNFSMSAKCNPVVGSSSV